MTDEGYLQNKLRELKEQVEHAETKLEAVTAEADLKLKEIKDISTKMAALTQPLEESAEKKVRAEKALEQAYADSKEWHEQNYAKVVKLMKKNMEQDFEGVKTTLTKRVDDFCVGAHVLLEFLISERLINSEKYLKFLNAHWDKLAESYDNDSKDSFRNVSIKLIREGEKVNQNE